MKLKEVNGGVCPLGEEAVNRTLAIGACSTECVHILYIDVCVSFSVHQYGFLHGDTFKCVCLGVSGTQPSCPLLGLVTTAGLCHPLTTPPPSLTYSMLHFNHWFTATQLER